MDMLQISFALGSRQGTRFAVAAIMVLAPGLGEQSHLSRMNTLLFKQPIPEAGE